MRQVKSEVFLGMLTLALIGSFSLGYATDSTTAEVEAATMEAAIVDSQSADNQAVYDAAYQSTLGSANNQATADILAQKNAVINAVKAEIDATTDATRLAALETMLEQLQADYSTTMYTSAFGDVPTTAVNSTADAEALTLASSTLSSEMAAVQAEIDAANAEAEATRLQSIRYAQSHSYSLLNSTPAVPRVADGTQAIIYGLDSSSVYFYVDAGSWSGVSTGDQYPVIDSDGDGVAYLEVVVCSEIYSVGILVYSTDAVVGNMVKGLVTCQTNPYTGE